MYALEKNLLVKLCAFEDEVTTTDELIPSARPLPTALTPSSFRSLPFRRCPQYVENPSGGGAGGGAAKGGVPQEAAEVLAKVGDLSNTTIGSCIFAKSRGWPPEQAASCQKVLGALPTFVTSTPPSATAPTASTGALCLYHRPQ